MNTFQLVYQDVRGGQGITLEAKDHPETLSLGSGPVVLTTLQHGSFNRWRPCCGPEILTLSSVNMVESDSSRASQLVCVLRL